MNKKFCDICDAEIPVIDKKNVWENNIYVRLEGDDKKFEVQDACDDCIAEYKVLFKKYIKEKYDAVHDLSEVQDNGM